LQLFFAMNLLVVAVVITVGMRKIAIIHLVLGMVILLSCKKEVPAVPDEDITGVPQISVETILTGYEIIWGMDFLPGGDLIFGEKRGKLYKRSGESVSAITGFPQVLASGQGGLLDIRVHPDYSANSWIYASYAASDPGGGGLLKLIRFKITGNQVQNIENLFSTDGSNTWLGHYGSRIAFDKDRYLYLSVGEGGSTSYGGPGTGNNNGLDGTSDWGKIHRLKDDGSVPADNPVIQGNSIPTSVYSIGHRNPQGMAVHPETGDIWSSEHGPKGGDELNIVAKGANFGWPAYSLGVNYDGTTISSGHNGPGITPPVYYWTPSIGICGIAFITASEFRSWKGNLLVSGLASQKLYRCVEVNNQIVQEEVLLSGYGRVRNVIQAPDGSVYVSVENPGRILRIIPE
jgi:aldose sugar dehydrogenase